MADRTYKLIELVGISEKSYAEATKNAVARASETLDGLAWFEVTEMRGLIVGGNVSEFQVKLKVGFRLHDTDGVHAPEAAMPARRRIRSVRRARG